MVSTTPIRYQRDRSDADKKKRGYAQNIVEGTERFMHPLTFCREMIVKKGAANLSCLEHSEEQKASGYEVNRPQSQGYG